MRQNQAARRTQRNCPADRSDHQKGDPPIALIVDAGPLYAYIDADDQDHKASLALLGTHPGPLIVPQFVVTEVAYLLETRLGWIPEVRFIGDLAAGNLVSEPVLASDWIRIADLVAQYHDLPLGTVDGSVVAASERLGVKTIATLDRRHFGIVRPKHVDAFELLP